MPLDFARGPAILAGLSPAQLGQHAADNIVWLVLAAGLPPLITGLLWLWLPKRVQVLLKWLDELLPGDFSALHRSASLVIVGALSIGVLIPAVLAVLWSLGVNIDAALGVFGDFGRETIAWAGSQGVKILIVLFIAALFQRFGTRAIPRAIEAYIRERARTEQQVVEAELEKRTKTLSGVLVKTFSIVVVLGATFMVLAQLGVSLAPLLAATGVVGIAVGFGAQNLIRDIFAGIFIVLENQYRVGDVVTIAGIGGLVEDINLRRTVLRDLDYRQHYIPNGEIRTATNMTKDKSRVNLNIGVAYKEDLERVMQVLNDIGKEMAGDPYWGPLILDAPKALRVDNFGDSAIEIKVLGETLPIRQWDVAGEYRLRVKKAFDRLGIEIPFPHRTIYWGAREPNVMLFKQMHEQVHQGAGSTPSDVPRPPVEGPRLPEKEGD
ncbi:MAG: mechanosensitive ion channel family protein [Chloroflexota bacterium]